MLTGFAMVMFAVNEALKTLCLVDSLYSPDMNFVTVRGKARVMNSERMSRNDSDTPSIPYCSSKISQPMLML